LSDLPAAQQAIDYLTLSFYPPATRQMLRVALIAVVVFVVALNLYRAEGQITRVLTWIAGMGAAVALLAIAQGMAGSEEIYWSTPIGKRAVGGTFVNQNHFAQFMNLSIGAMLALLFVYLKKWGRLEEGWTSRLMEEQRPLVLLGSGIIVCATALFLSGSRGGMLSLLVAFGITAAVASVQKGIAGRGWLLVILGFGIFAAVSYTGIDVVTKRLATLEDLEKASGARWQMNQDVIQSIVPQYPLTGIGLGAHEVVYPMYSRLPDAGLATHVENEYLQLIEELGIIGVLIVAAFLAIIITHYVRLVRRPTRSVHAAAVGLGYGLIAVAVHSLTDFGQRIPANLGLSMLFCALLIGLSRFGKPAPAIAPATAPAMVPAWRPKLAGIGGIAGALLLLVALGWGLFGAVRAANAEAHWNQALAIEEQLAAEGWSEASNEDLAALIALAEVAVQNEPDDIHYRHWLNTYRWRAISREIDPDTGNFVMDEESLGYAARIADELHAARPLCPTFGPMRSLVGQIELFVLGRDSGELHIHEGSRLAPLDPTTTFVAGRLDASKGDWREALAKFHRSVQLGHPPQDIVDLYVRELENPRQALAFAEGDGEALLYLAQLLSETSDIELATAARLSAIEALGEEVKQSAATPRQHASLAELLFEEKQFAAATERYRSALAGDYGNVHWRLRLAQSLAASGHVQQAMKEARVCQRLRPESPSVTKLIEELSLQPGAMAQ
jgi:O-antigen ligase